MISTAMIALLAACSSESTDDTSGGSTGGTGGTGGSGGGVTAPAGAQVDGDLDAAAFDETAETMVVFITLDGDDVEQTYVRTASLDTGGYQAYTLHDDPLDRHFTAFGKTSEDGSTSAVLVLDGGQFNRFFAGTQVSASTYAAPTTGLTSYAGEYVGLTNIGTRTGTLISGADDVLLPERGIRTTGTVFINADFGDNQINGAIYDRAALDGGTFDTPDIILTPTDITSSGTFAGGVEYTDLTPVGQYTGVFGGDNAAAVAGSVNLTEFDATIDGEEEWGIFVLNQCGLAGASADCGTFNVDDLGE